MSGKKNILKILFIWELIRILIIFFISTIVFNSQLDPAFSFFIAFLMSPQALIVSIVFLSIFSIEEYARNRTIILTGKTFNLSFLVILLFSDTRVIKYFLNKYLLNLTEVNSFININLKVGLFFILILDLIFFFFLLSYKEKECLVPLENTK